MNHSPRALPQLPISLAVLLAFAAANARADTRPAATPPGAAAPASASASPASSPAAVAAPGNPGSTAPAPSTENLPPLPVLDRMDLAKMHAGKIISEASDDDGLGHGGKAHGWAICKCKIDKLWDVLTHHEAFPEFVPRVVGMEISRRTDHGERTTQTIDASIQNVKYSLDFDWNVSTRTINFHLAEDAPHDLKAVKGVWQLWPIDHGDFTLFDYQSAVDSGRSIPGFIRDYLADRGIKDTMDAVRRRAEGLPSNK